MKYRCPVCQKTVTGLTQEKSEEAEFFPFCSRRCKLIDLGAWLDADYKIVSSPESRDSGGPPDTSPTSSEKQ
jgi:endogenous inhibitor of DNA gyrase (YacG/DUF329 family)